MLVGETPARRVARLSLSSPAITPRHQPDSERQPGGAVSRNELAGKTIRMTFRMVEESWPGAMSGHDWRDYLTVTVPFIMLMWPGKVQKNA